MSPLGSISAVNQSPLLRMDELQSKVAPDMSGLASGAPTPPGGFSNVLDGLISTVTSKESSAQAVTRQVLLGNSDQLHQSVIAMQEASVAFSMMVEVRNKLVDSYQELMRMQV